MCDLPRAYTQRGIFRPKKMDNLRPVIAPLVGRELAFDFAGHSGEGEAYPGQRRWTIARLGNDIAENQMHWWVPEEDIEWLPEMQPLSQ